MAHTAREVITLQVGHYANFVGTHWWNLQESSFVYSSTTPTDINHDYLFREGITAQGQVTYTPRLLCLDVRGSLGSLPVLGRLYSPLQCQPCSSHAAWHGTVQYVQQSPEEKNEYLKDLEEEDEQLFKTIDEDKDICSDDIQVTPTPTHKLYDLTHSVKVWSDFLRPHLHPSSVYLMNAEAGSGSFKEGLAVLAQQEVEEEVTDRIRLQAEACDSLQGFQVLSEVGTGMSGVGCGVLQHLADDYDTKDVLTFPTTPHLPPATPQDRTMAHICMVQAYTAMSNLSSVVVPLHLNKSLTDAEASGPTFPNLKLQACGVPYESSSVLAAFLDTWSLAYRRRTYPYSLASLAALLTPAARTVTGASLALPLGLGHDQTLQEWLQGGYRHHQCSLSGFADLWAEPVSEATIIRGIPSTKLVRPGVQGAHYTSSSQLYEGFLQDAGVAPSQRLVTGVQDALKVAAPYPAIFPAYITQHGFIDPHSKVLTPVVESVPALATVHQGGGMAPQLQQLLNIAENIDVSKNSTLVQEGVDKEAWKTLTEDLHSLTARYSSKMGKEMLDSDDD